MALIKQFVGSAFLAGLMLASSARAAEPSCQAFANDTIRHVVDIFHDTKQNEIQKRAVLASVFQEALDIDWIGKFVLGHFWKTATLAEQAEYLKGYRAYITQSYISRFNDEDGMSVDDIVVSSLNPQSAGQFEAKTLIRRKNEEDVRVDYLLDDNSGRCQVHDIKVEGVSMLASERSEFAALANSSGVKGVIAAMQRQLAD